MSILDTKTELFDLFGESGTCVICQDDFSEGERVRAITKCQHIFHSKCLDPWIKQKPECPMCRLSLEDTRDDINKRIARLQSVIDNLNGVIGETLAPFLNQIETSLAPAPPPLERYILGYCLSTGILRKFDTAAVYDTSRNTIRHYMIDFESNSVRPVPLDFTSRASLSRSRYTIGEELRTRMGLSPTNQIGARPQVRAVMERLSSNQGLAAFWKIS